MNKKLSVYMHADMHEDLKALAFQKKTTMAALVRYALDKTFEDDLDDISSRRALEEAAADADRPRWLGVARRCAHPACVYRRCNQSPKRVSSGTHA